MRRARLADTTIYEMEQRGELCRPIPGACAAAAVRIPLCCRRRAMSARPRELCLISASYADVVIVRETPRTTSCHSHSIV